MRRPFWLSFQPSFPRRFRILLWPASWLVLFLLGSVLLVRWDIAQRREQFHGAAQLAVRLLSQQLAQQEALLAALVTLAPVAGEARLQAIYPQLLGVLRRNESHPWEAPDTEKALLDRAEQQSATIGSAVLTGMDTANRHYLLVRSARPTSYALKIDVERMMPWTDWPFARSGPVRVSMALDGAEVLLQAGQTQEEMPLGLTQGFVFRKALTTGAQALQLELRRATGPAQWPWIGILIWALGSFLMILALANWRARELAQRRSRELWRVGQVSRINALGEMAAGLAHELNQPITAMMANGAAARRLLDDEPIEKEALQEALLHADEQARRAAQVVARLRKRVESPDSAVPLVLLDLAQHTRKTLDLFEPEFRRLGLECRRELNPVMVRADAIALEQITHNLLANAVQAQQQQARPQAWILVCTGPSDEGPVLSVSDNGPGVAAENLPRLFEPFFTTRSGGLGLGLSLCESLAQSMQATLTAQSGKARGAQFTLRFAPVRAESRAL